MDTPSAILNAQDTKNVVKDTLIMTLEMCFLFFLFFTALGVLNYFNILQLQKSFPFLRFLPHLQRAAPYTITQAPVATRAAVVTTIPYGSADEENEKALLQNFIVSVTPRSMLPASPSAFITSSAGSMHVFFIQWQQDKNLYQASLSTGYQGNPLIQRKLFLSVKPDPNSLADTAITAEQARQLLSGLLIAPTQGGIYHCGHLVANKVNINFCQTDTVTPVGKRSYGIFGPPGFLTVFACEIPKDSPYYFESNPCIANN